MSNAVITGVFALGGALLGFLGSWLAATSAAKATRKQIRASREQAQQDRIHERRDEAITESYAKILALDEGYRRILLLARSSDKESKREELYQLLTDVVDGWLTHFQKNLPWIPEALANRMVRIVRTYQKQAIDLRESLDGASEAQLPNVLEDAYSSLEAQKEELDFDWLRFDVRAALGIEEADIVSKKTLRDRNRSSE